MIRFHKPLFYIGIFLAAFGFFIWLILTIVNFNNDHNHLNTNLPTGMGLLGIISIIISLVLAELIPLMISKREKNNDEY